MISIAGGKRGVVRRRLSVRRAKSAAELRQGLGLKPAHNYKIHKYLSCTKAPEIGSRSNAKAALRAKPLAKAVVLK
jgi:hypothetical protein